MSERKERSPVLRFCESLLLCVCLLIILVATTLSATEYPIDSAHYPRDYFEYVEEASERFGIEKNMIYAIIKAESGFCETAVSHAGAIGLMQVTPDTFLFDIRDEIGLEGETSSALFYPRENILAGTYYYAKWKNHFGTDKEALAAYNAGIGNVQRWLADERYADVRGLIIENIPFAETRKYIQRVLLYKERYDKIYGREAIEKVEEPVSEQFCFVMACRYGDIYKIDPRFVMAIIKTESVFYPNTVSHAGAIGLMQIIRSTYEDDIKANLHLEESFDDLFDPEFNIRCGTYYLHWLDDRVDGLEQLAAAYNGGIGNVRSWLADERYSMDGETLIVDAIPNDEARRYVTKVMNYYDFYCERYPMD